MNIFERFFRAPREPVMFSDEYGVMRLRVLAPTHRAERFRIKNPRLLLKLRKRMRKSS